MHLLVVDDDPEITQVISDWIKREFAELTISAVYSGHQAIQAIEQGEKFDIIISDYEMPDGRGTEILEYLIQKKEEIYFILFTSHMYPRLPIITNDYFLGVVGKLGYDELLELLFQCQQIMSKN